MTPDLIAFLFLLALCVLFAWWLTSRPDAEPKPKRAPVVGELWPFASTDDPWGGKSRGSAKVLDVKDGWVRYAMLVDGHAGFLFQDERMKLSSFLYCYQPPENATLAACRGQR
jgi:hypothetical protein